jgi:anti-anti-sigma factor
MNTDRLPITQQHPSPSLLVDIDRSDETRPRVLVAGELDVLGGTDLHNLVIDLLGRQRPGRMEIDLRGVPFLDSAGIRTLLSCHRDAQQLGCRLTVTDPHPMAYRVLEITGLLDHLGVTAT